MKKHLFQALILAAALTGTVCFAAEKETEGISEAAVEAETEAGESAATERDLDPESGSGWLTATIDGAQRELEFVSATKGMTGTVYLFQGSGYSLSLLFDKKLDVDNEVEKNSINQAEVMSSTSESSGYYFVRKGAGKEVDGKAVLLQKTDDGLFQGEFSVNIPRGDRYVGDTKPGILEVLEITDGAFCFRE